MESILFVCTGNICRSPTMEGVLRTLAEQEGITLRVDSAGTHGYHIGEAPDPRSIKAAAERGYDISGLRARKLCARDFEQFDLILALDSGHYQELQRLCPPHLGHKVALYLEYTASKGEDVPDPYYGDAQGFETVLDMALEGCRNLLVKLRNQ